SAGPLSTMAVRSLAAGAGSIPGSAIQTIDEPDWRTKLSNIEKNALLYGGTEAIAGAVPIGAKYLQQQGGRLFHALHLAPEVMEVPKFNSSEIPGSAWNIETEPSTILDANGNPFTNVRYAKIPGNVGGEVTYDRRNPLALALERTGVGATTGAGAVGLQELLTGNWNPKRIAKGAGYGALAGLIVPPILEAGETQSPFFTSPAVPALGMKGYTKTVPFGEPINYVPPMTTGVATTGTPYLQRPEVANALANTAKIGIMGGEAAADEGKKVIAPSTGTNTAPEKNEFKNWVGGEAAPTKKESSFGEWLNSKAEAAILPGVDRIAAAISHAEGSKPELNNPGNIKDMKTGEIRKFATPEEGLNALKN